MGGNVRIPAVPFKAEHRNRCVERCAVVKIGFRLDVREIIVPKNANHKTADLLIQSSIQATEEAAPADAVNGSGNLRRKVHVRARNGIAVLIGNAPRIVVRHIAFDIVGRKTVTGLTSNVDASPVDGRAGDVWDIRPALDGIFHADVCGLSRT